MVETWILCFSQQKYKDNIQISHPGVSAARLHTAPVFKAEFPPFVRSCLLHVFVCVQQKTLNCQLLHSSLRIHSTTSFHGKKIRPRFFSACFTTLHLFIVLYSDQNIRYIYPGMGQYAVYVIISFLWAVCERFSPKQWPILAEYWKNWKAKR